MGAFSFLTRNQRPGILLNLTDHAVQVARLGPLDDSPVEIDYLAELSGGNDEQIAQWLREAFPDHRRGYLPGYCGFHPVERVLLREIINTKRLAEPDFLPGLLTQHAKLAAVSGWQINALHPVDGELLNAAMPSRPALVVGLPPAPARRTQQRLCKLGIRPQRLELGSLALFGGLMRYLRDTAFPHAVVVCEIGRTQTQVYFLAKDGVHTPVTLPHGLLSIEESAMKELSSPDLAHARAQLAEPSAELRAHSRRLVRMVSRHLKPAIGYFEMQTGQPIGGLFAGHLPANLGWLEEALAAANELEFIVPNLSAWLRTIGVRLPAATATPARNWFQPLNLIGRLAPEASHAAQS